MSDKKYETVGKPSKKYQRTTMVMDTLKATASCVGINEGVEMITGVSMAELYAEHMAPMINEFAGVDTTLGTGFAIYLGMRAIKRLTEQAVVKLAAMREPGPSARGPLHDALKEFIDNTNITVAKYDNKRNGGVYWVKDPGQEDWTCYTEHEFRALQSLQADRPFHVINFAENGKKLVIETQYEGVAIHETKMESDSGLFNTKVRVAGQPDDIVDQVLEESKMAVESIFSRMPSLTAGKTKDDEQKATLGSPSLG